MVHRLAQGIDSASADAGISAFLAEAGLVSRTVGVDDTFWIDADCNAVPDPAFAVVAAWRWIAGIRF